MLGCITVTEIILCVFLYIVVLSCLACFSIFMTFNHNKEFAMSNGKVLAFVMFMKLYITLLVGVMLLKPFSDMMTTTESWVAVFIMTIVTAILERPMIKVINRYILKRDVPIKRSNIIFGPVELPKGVSNK